MTRHPTCPPPRHGAVVVERDVDRGGAAAGALSERARVVEARLIPEVVEELAIELDIESARVLDHGSVAGADRPGRPVDQAVVGQRARVQDLEPVGVDRERRARGDRGRAGPGLDPGGHSKLPSRSSALPPRRHQTTQVGGGRALERSVRQDREPPEIAAWTALDGSTGRRPAKPDMPLVGRQTWSAGRKRVARSSCRLSMRHRAAIPADGRRAGRSTLTAPRATSAAANPTKVAVMPTS